MLGGQWPKAIPIPTKPFTFASIEKLNLFVGKITCSSFYVQFSVVTLYAPQLVTLDHESLPGHGCLGLITQSWRSVNSDLARKAYVEARRILGLRRVAVAKNALFSTSPARSTLRMWTKTFFVQCSSWLVYKDVAQNTTVYVAISEAVTVSLTVFVLKSFEPNRPWSFLSLKRSHFEACYY